MVNKFKLNIFYYIRLFLFKDSSAAFDVEKFRQEVLAQHNAFRAEQCADPLQRNSTLDDRAQNWTDKIVETGQFVHSNTTKYGENSFYQVPFDFNKDNGIFLFEIELKIIFFILGATPVIVWYNEKANYTVANPGRTLHFTQVVWKATKIIGVGVRQVSNNGLVVVVNYYPRGNYENQFAQNVGCSN